VQAVVLLAPVSQQGQSVEEVCDHALARQEVPEYFFCFGCEVWLNLDGEIVPDPTVTPAAPAEDGGPDAKKAPARVGAGVNQSPKRSYRRDPSKMVKVKCSHPGCKRTWKVWPQNIPERPLCPEIHGPLEKAAQNREAQRRWRQNRAAKMD
jgi:hypothetical protein